VSASCRRHIDSGFRDDWASGGKARRRDHVRRDPHHLDRVSIAEQMASHAILPAEISLSESRVHDRDILAGGCIASPREVAPYGEYLQRLEIRRCHINQVGHVLVARLRAIPDSYRVVECAFIGNG